MALTLVSKDLTQPHGSKLATPEEVTSRLSALETSRRARFGIAGFSGEGREIPYVVLSSPENILRLDALRSSFRRASTPRVFHQTLESVLIERSDDTRGADLKIPVLLTGGTFGFEASLTEALLQVASYLSTSVDDSTKSILDGQLVIVMPMTNPDGTTRAIAEWSKTPTSCGWSGCGNTYGFLLNRDFMNLSQPETRAVAEIWRQWAPLVAFDPQEDIVILGVGREELCWCPPYRAGTYPELLPPTTYEWVQLMGEDIASRWREGGFRPLYDSTGETGMLEVLGSLGARCAVTAMFHDMVALETESARTPGVQTWADRNQQKFLAAMTILDVVAAHRKPLIEQMLPLRNYVDTRQDRCYVIPELQADRGLLHAFLGVLLRHQVRLYQVSTPFPAYVVPLSQPRPYLIQFLMSDWPESAAQCLAPEYGIVVMRGEDMAETEQGQLREASLKPVTGAPAGGVRLVSEPEGGRDVQMLSLSPTATHTRLAMRLLPKYRVMRASRSLLDLKGHQVAAGAFLLDGVNEGKVRQIAMRPANEALAIDLERLRVAPPIEAEELSIPRVALYTGQGCTYEHKQYVGDIRFGLDYLEIPYVELTDHDLHREDSLDYTDALIVPNGLALQIVNGLAAGAAYFAKSPWTLPERSVGIGEPGIDTIRRFVDRGGRYLGFGSGGGELAGNSWSGMLDIELDKDQYLDPGPVALSIRTRDSSLFHGYPAASFARARLTDNSVSTHFGIVESWFLKAEYPAQGLAPLFRVGGKVSVLAEIGRTGYPAIMWGSYGAGEVLVFAVTVTFRGIWISTALLLANALLAAPGSLAG